MLQREKEELRLTKSRLGCHLSIYGLLKGSIRFKLKASLKDYRGWYSANRCVVDACSGWF